MSLTLSELTAIAQAVAVEEDAALEVMSVASNDAETDRVELLITVAGCHDEPCTFLINVSRSERRRFENTLRAEFRSALDTHPG